MEQQTKRRLAAVMGPTAVGKTEYTIALANRLDGEIISCDSMQLYRYMDIGSAKPTPEERAQARHYLVDEIDPREPFSAAEYQKRARDAIETVFRRGKLPIIEGGTGLYLDALLYDLDFSAPPDESGRGKYFSYAEKYGNEALHRRLADLDPASASRIHPNNVKRVARALEAAESGRPIGDFSRDPERTGLYDAILIGLTRDRQELYERIDRRADLLVERGLVDEVRGLLTMGLTENDISMKGIGYKEIIGYLNGQYSLGEAVDLMKRNTRHFAKRQMTWFRRYPDVLWYNLSEYDDREQAVRDMAAYLSRRLSEAEFGKESQNAQ